MTSIQNLSQIWRENPELAKSFVPKYLRTKINELTEEIRAAEQLLSEIEGFDSVRKVMCDSEGS